MAHAHGTMSHKPFQQLVSSELIPPDALYSFLPIIISGCFAESIPVNDRHIGHSNIMMVLHMAHAHPTMSHMMRLFVSCTLFFSINTNLPIN